MNTPDYLYPDCTPTHRVCTRALWPWILLAATLAGCAAPNVRDAGHNVAGQGTVEQSRLSIGSAAPGDILTLADDGQRVRMLFDYHAASGRLCRRLQPLDESGHERIACRTSDGEWRLRRSLSALGRLPSDSAVALVGASIASGDDFLLARGETLSGFALRMTGSVSNWPRIAEVNGVEHPERLPAGMRLQVPLSLLAYPD